MRIVRTTAGDDNLTLQKRTPDFGFNNTASAKMGETVRLFEKILWSVVVEVVDRE